MRINIQKRQLCNNNRLGNCAGGGAIHTCQTSITREALFSAWRHFKKGKEKKNDVLAFADIAEQHLHDLWQDIVDDRYTHGTYQRFQIADPKLRTINKASVRDRIIHHMLHRILEPLFEPGFIYDSYSSRTGKGGLKAVDRFEQFARRLSVGNKRAVWVLKCDIRKFFDSIDHEILFARIQQKAFDTEVLALVKKVLTSFELKKGKGLPLGNLTSQLFANIYMDIFDQYVKRALGVKCYIRYADDFLILTHTPQEAQLLLSKMNLFLQERLKLDIHPDKIYLRTWRQGVDVLGYISYPTHRAIRTKTKHRIRKKVFHKKLLLQQNSISVNVLNQTMASYRGRTKHCWSKELETFLFGDLLLE